MANNNVPAPDFAPPWLKVPSYVPSLYHSTNNSTRHTSRRDVNNRYISAPGNFANSAAVREPEPQVSSKNRYLGDSRQERAGNSGERKNNYISSRHNSLDHDDTDTRLYSSASSTTLANGAALRRPHSRHDFRNILPYGKTSQTSDNFDNSRAKCFNDSDLITDNFNQEFPSLQGEGEVQPVTTVNGGVWEKPRNAKVLGAGGKKAPPTKRPSKEANSEGFLSLPLRGGVVVSVGSHSPKLSSQNNRPIYRATIVPTKNCLGHKREVLKFTAKETNGLSKVPSGPPAVNPNPIKKPSTTPPPMLDILVKNPKSKVKNEFFKALRTENREKPVPKQEFQCDSKTSKKEEDMAEPANNDQEEKEAKPEENGIPIVGRNCDEEVPILSSSLEAERKFLKQMGWREGEGDIFKPLTPDEIKEIKQNISSSQKKNGVIKLKTTFQSPVKKGLPPPLDDSSDDSDSDSSSSSSD